MRHWSEIAPENATDLNLHEDMSIEAPLNEAGERCAWPWEPQQLVGVPLGQYHCEWCGAMVVAGVPHPDYRPVVAAVSEPKPLTCPMWGCDEPLEEDGIGWRCPKDGELPALLIEEAWGIQQ